MNNATSRAILNEPIIIVNPCPCYFEYTEIPELHSHEVIHEPYNSYTPSAREVVTFDDPEFATDYDTI